MTCEGCANAAKKVLSKFGGNYNSTILLLKWSFVSWTTKITTGLY